MADEGVVNKDANASGSGSSPDAKPNVAGSPPVSEKLTPDTSEVNAIPYSRFSEVIRERNEARARAEANEIRLRELESSRVLAPRENVVDVQSKRLAEKLKMDPAAAREIAEAAREISRAERGQLEQRMKANEINSWLVNLSAKHKDFKDVEPLMDKEFSGLPPEEKAYISSSPQRLEMFYNHVKASVAEQKEKAAYEKGVEDAYKNKTTKSSVSSVPGQTSQPQKGQLTLAAIRAMTPKEYKDRQNEINDAIKKGVLK